MAQGAEHLLSLGISALPSGHQHCPEAGVGKGFLHLYFPAVWMEMWEQEGPTLWGAVPQSLLHEELGSWCKQSSCSGRCWLLPVPEPISLGINQPELQHENHFKLAFPASPEPCFGNIELCAPAAQAGQGHQSWEGIARAGGEQKTPR